MKNINVLSVEVSYFQKCFDCEQPTTVNLLTFLRSEKHRAAVEQVRAIEDKAERDNLKKSLLPGITPSGVFTHRAESGLVKHSGLIAGDVDTKDNPYTPESLKTFVSSFSNVAYCGLSASGLGIWFLVPIAHPERHKEHFAALVTAFNNEGIVLDTAPANVASFRFYSYDQNAYFNPGAIPYTKLQTRQPDTYTPGNNSAPVFGNAGEKLGAITRQIEARRMDITGNYEQWFALLSALATLGENGREYAHRISQFYPTYSHRETDKQFNHCLRMKSNRFTLGTLFKIAADCGLTFREYFAQEARQTRPGSPRHVQPPAPAPMPAPRVEPPTDEPMNVQQPAPALPPGYKYFTYKDSSTGDPVKVLLNADGYPATWDVSPAAHEALSKAVKSNPLVTELITRFDLQLTRLESVQPEQCSNKQQNAVK